MTCKLTIQGQYFSVDSFSLPIHFHLHSFCRLLSFSTMSLVGAIPVKFSSRKKNKALRGRFFVSLHNFRNAIARLEKSRTLNTQRVWVQVPRNEVKVLLYPAAKIRWIKNPARLLEGCDFIVTDIYIRMLKTLQCFHL